MTTWHYLVFRVKHGERYDVRLPDGGVVVEADTEELAYQLAYLAAEVRIHCAAGELVVCHPVRDRRRRRQVRLMHDDWVQGHAHCWN